MCVLIRIEIRIGVSDCSLLNGKIVMRRCVLSHFTEKHRSSVTNAITN